MYCYPYPRTSSIKRIRVPYLAGAPILHSAYTFADFVKLAHIPAPPATIQLCMFFGFVSRILDRDIQHQELLEIDSLGYCEPWIDLCLPQQILLEHEARMATIPTGEIEREKQRLKETLHETASCLPRFEAQGRVAPDNDHALVLLSIYMLVRLFFGIDFYCDHSLRVKPDKSSSQILRRRMLQNGWCQKRLNCVDLIEISIPALYFLSSMRPPRVFHEDHQACTAEQCSVTRGLATPLHRTAGCNCQNVSVPLDRIAEIVGAGGIPLVRVRKSPDSIELDVVAYQRRIRFVVISHVWADRQLGSAENSLPRCQVENLDSILATLPLNEDSKILRSLNIWPRKSLEGNIHPTSRTYEFFWLDTFCVPQHPRHNHLKMRAIESMNLVYAAASQTLVLDAGLQQFDARQKASSLSPYGQPTFYGPSDDYLLDVLAQICASNWMGRAWTLQEGALSKHTIFPLNGSLVFLRHLAPSLDMFTFEDSSHLEVFLQMVRDAMPAKKDTFSQQGRGAQLKPYIRLYQDLFEFTQLSLNMDLYILYAREPSDRALLFVRCHRLLQSRSTTQPEDLPLILVNLACVNGNSISHCKSVEERMRQLVYCLEIVPIELLFSDGERIRSGDVDAWIPKRIDPEPFPAFHYLKLGTEGFTFQQKHSDSDLHLLFFLIPEKEISDKESLVYFCGRSKSTIAEFLVTPLRSLNQRAPVSSQHGWCILLEGLNFSSKDDATVPIYDDKPDHRGARFSISRIVGNKVFLIFDCPIRIARCQDSKLHSGVDFEVAMFAKPLQEFVIEKSNTPRALDMYRPQNALQAFNQLADVAQLVEFVVLPYISMKTMYPPLGPDFLRGLLFVLFMIIQMQLYNYVCRVIAHHSWFATYHPEWKSKRLWRLYWTISNYRMSPWGKKFIYITAIFLTLLAAFYRIILWNVLVYATLVFFWPPGMAVHSRRGALLTGVLAQRVIDDVWKEWYRA